MAKRMLDTEIWSQRWFCDLSTDAKMLYFYFWGNCNHAGILDLWEKRYKDDTGLSLSKCISEMDGLIIEYKPGSFLMPKFISDQYPDFPNSNVRSQDSAIKILDREGLLEFILNPLERVSKPLVKAYEHEHGYDNDINNKGVVEKKSNLPAKTATWNNIKIGTKVPKRDHHVMAWDDFLKYQENHDRRSCEKINAPLVFLSDREYKALKDKYKSEQIVKAMIMVMNNWKAKTKFAHQKNLNDYLCIDDAWVLEKAEKELRIINSTTVENLRKREKVAEEIRNSNQGITYYEPEPKQQPTE